MDYGNWIKRERRIRSSLSKIGNDKIEGVFRICSECSEVLLCFEDRCPNCDSATIDLMPVACRDADFFREQRIRCKHRFQNIMSAEESRNE